jgi:hypothetical protein
MFFSDEKNQKTFILASLPRFQDMAGTTLGQFVAI